MSCHKSSSLRFCSCLGPHDEACVANAEMWVVPWGLAAPNPLLLLLSRAAGPSAHGWSAGGVPLQRQVSSLSANESLCMAGCVLNIASSKSCRLLQEQRRRQSFEVNLCYYLSKKAKLLILCLSLHLVRSRQGSSEAGSCDSDQARTRMGKEKCKSQTHSFPQQLYVKVTVF